MEMFIADTTDGIKLVLVKRAGALRAILEGEWFVTGIDQRYDKEAKFDPLTDIKPGARLFCQVNPNKDTSRIYWSQPVIRVYKADPAFEKMLKEKDNKWIIFTGVGSAAESGIGLQRYKVIVKKKIMSDDQVFVYLPVNNRFEAPCPVMFGEKENETLLPNQKNVLVSLLSRGCSLTVAVVPESAHGKFIASNKSMPTRRLAPIVASVRVGSFFGPESEKAVQDGLARALGKRPEGPKIMTPEDYTSAAESSSSQSGIRKTIQSSSGLKTFVSEVRDNDAGKRVYESEKREQLKRYGPPPTYVQLPKEYVSKEEIDALIARSKMENAAGLKTIKDRPDFSLMTSMSAAWKREKERRNRAKGLRPTVVSKQ